jgi:hypothetical protein
MVRASKTGKEATGKFINPNFVTDVETWAKFRINKYQNLVIDYATGNMLVLNKENLSEVVKTIPIPRALDVYRALDLYRTATDPIGRERYSLALQQFNKMRGDMISLENERSTQNQQSAYELAQAIAIYKQSPSIASAKQVAQIQKSLAGQEKEAAKSLTRAVKPFEYTFVPAGDFPTPPTEMYIKYTSLPDSRKIDFTEAGTA